MDTKNTKIGRISFSKYTFFAFIREKKMIFALKIRPKNAKSHEISRWIDWDWFQFSHQSGQFSRSPAMTLFRNLSNYRIILTQKSFSCIFSRWAQSVDQSVRVLSEAVPFAWHRKNDWISLDDLAKWCEENSALLHGDDGAQQTRLSVLSQHTKLAEATFEP